MKRLIFLFAMLFALSTSYAQPPEEGEPGQEEVEGGEGGENEPVNIPDPEECCPGTNLFGNGNFNSSTLPNFFSYPSFHSDYSVISSWTSAIPNGSYGHFRPNSTNWVHNTICNHWQIKDLINCNSQTTGGFLVVNGLTNGHGQKKVFEFNMTLQGGVYNMCADFKYARSQCFDYWGPDLTWKVTGANTVQKVFNVNTPNNDNGSTGCDWQTEILNFAVNSPSETVTITLYQNADRYMDGNDFVMDNISLKKISNVSSSNVSFNASLKPILGGKYNITCTLQNPLSAPCGYSWSWCKWDGANCVSSTINGTSTSNSSVVIPSVPAHTTVKVVCTAQCPCGLATSSYAIVVTGNGTRIAFPSSELKPGELTGLEAISNNPSLSDHSSHNHGAELPELDETTFDIFPNPNNGEFTIHSPGVDLENAEVTIYSAEGKKVFYSEVRIINGDEIPLQLQELPSGMYKVVLSNNQTRQQSSLVIK